MQLIEILDFDLRPYARRREGRGCFQCWLDATCRRNVILFDENAVVESDAMIGAAAHAHGIFLREPQAGQRFAGIDDFRARAGYRFDEAAGAGGHRGEHLHEVQRRAFARQQCARFSPQGDERRAGRCMVAFFNRPLD